MFDSNETFLNVKADDGCIHMSWKSDERVIVFEELVDNYPTGGIFEFSSVEVYLNSIKDIGWINRINNVRNVSDEIKSLGYPFLEQF